MEQELGHIKDVRAIPLCAPCCCLTAMALFWLCAICAVESEHCPARARNAHDQRLNQAGMYYCTHEAQSPVQQNLRQRTIPSNHAPWLLCPD